MSLFGTRSKLAHIIQWAGADADYDKVLADLSLPSDDRRFKAARGATVFGIATQDPVKAIKMISDSPGNFSPGIADNVGARGWRHMESRSGTDKALQWLDSISDPVVRKKAIHGAAVSNAASYIEGTRSEASQSALAGALRISDLIPVGERAEVFADFPILDQDAN